MHTIINTYTNELHDCISVITSCNENGAEVDIAKLENGEPINVIKYTFTLQGGIPHIRCRGPKQKADRWPLTSGIYLGNQRDPFVRCSKLVFKTLFAEAYKRKWMSGHTSVDSSGVSNQMRTLYHQLSEVACHLAAQCDQEARSLAMKFLPHLRFRLYQAFVQDSTGRLMQMAETHPGILIFALAFREQSASSPVTELIFTNIIEGYKPSRIIDEALDAWSLKIRVQCRDSEYGFRTLDERGSKRWQEVMQAQKILIKRARPRVATTYLWVPPPLQFAPEDIPVKVMANARWYKIMKSRDHIWSLQEPSSDRVRRGYSSFLSSNGTDLFKRNSSSMISTINEIFDYLKALGRVVGRNTSAVKLQNDAAAWHRLVSETGDLEQLALAINEPIIDPERPLVNPIPEWYSERGSIFPLTKVGHLIDEGRRMGHCVASRLPYAITGHRHYFSAVIHGNALTIEAKICGNRLSLTEVKGVRNRLPIDSEQETIAQWIKHFSSPQCHHVAKGALRRLSATA